jgi:hypothetical protein
MKLVAGRTAPLVQAKTIACATRSIPDSCPANPASHAAARPSMLFIATSHRLAEPSMSSLLTFSIASRASNREAIGLAGSL